MKFANIDGRAHIEDGEGFVDVSKASLARFPSDPQECFAHWDAIRDWARDAPWPADAVQRVSPERFLAPVPRPSQIFAVGLNYQSHAVETGLTGSDQIPLTFTKFVSSIAGPSGTIELPSDFVDWEVELVIVMGRPTYRVSENDAWDAVAGLTVGQDVSDRSVQMIGEPPQFSLGKSFPGFAPIGPLVITPDELRDRDDIRLRCLVNEDVVQDGQTSDLIYSVPRLISLYSHICPLQPGDLIFSGTPAGVGMGRKPPRYLRPGDTLRTMIDGIGEMRHQCTSGASHVSS